MSRLKLSIFLVLPLLALAYPAFSDPLLGTPRELAPVRIDAAYGTRGIPAVATNGTESLVVWRDYAAKKILYSMLDARGAASLPKTLSIETTELAGYPVAAASDGHDFLVAWRSDSEDRSTTVVRVAAVSNDGSIITIRENSWTIASDVSLAWNGRNYLLIFNELRIGGGLTAALLDRDGYPAGERVRLAGDSIFFPIVTSSGSDFLVVFGGYVPGGGQTLYAMVVPGSGDITTAVALSSDSTSRVMIYGFDASSDGNRFGVVWIEESLETRSIQLRGRTVGLDGVLSPSVAIAGDVALNSPSISWAGSSYILTFSRKVLPLTTFKSDLLYVQLDAQLQSLSPEVAIDRATGDGVYSQLDSRGSTTALTWPHVVPRQPDGSALPTTVLAGVLTSAGSFSAPTLVSAAAAQQQNVSAASNAATTLVAWEERTGIDQQRKVRAQLAQMGAEDPIVLSDSDVEQTAPVVAASPTGFFVAWVEHRENGAVLSGRVFNETGGAARAAVTLAAYVAPESKLAALWDGDRFVVAFENVDGRIQLAFTDLPGGNAVTVSPVRYLKDHYPAIAFSGSEYLVAWNATQYPDCQVTCPLGSDIRAARVNRDGSVLDPAPVRMSPNLLGPMHPRVLWDGHEFVITRGTTSGVTARRILADGTPLDSLNGIPLTRESADVHNLTFDGSTFALAFTPYNYGGTALARLSLKAFSQLESVIDTPFTICDRAATSLALMSAGPGRLILADTTRLDASPYSGSTRVMLFSGTVSPSAALPSPVSMGATSLGPTVMIQWVDRSSDETGFAIEQPTPHGTAELALAEANQTVLFVDRSVTAGSWFRVVAVRDAERSEASEIMIIRSNTRQRGVRPAARPTGILQNDYSGF